MLGQLLEFVRTAIQETILTLGYAGIALVMFAENVFPPIPSELVMPFAGWLARDGKMDLVASIFAGTAGTVAGAIVLYHLGSSQTNRSSVGLYGITGDSGCCQKTTWIAHFGSLRNTAAPSCFSGA